MEFGKKLQQLRKESHMSQEKLAEHLNVSRQAVSKWEQGTAVPDTENIVRISKFFQVPIEFLLLDKYDTVDETIDNTNAGYNAPSPKQNSGHFLTVGLILEAAAVFGCYVMQWYELTLFNRAWSNALLYLFKMPVILLVLLGAYFLLRGYCKAPLHELWKNATKDALRNTLDESTYNSCGSSEQTASENETAESKTEAKN